VVCVGAFVASFSPAATAIQRASRPQVVVVPSRALLDNESAEVDVTHLAPFDFVSFEQCAATTAGGTTCATPSYANADSHGTVRAPITVRRMVAASGATYDCTLAQCSIAVFAGSQTTSVPITFDLGAPLTRSDLPAQAPCVQWPTQGWPTASIPAGVDANAVSAVGAQMIAGGATGVVVIHGGRLVYEKYAPGDSAATIQPSFSVSKSFESTVIGLLWQQGRLQLDARAPIAQWADPSDPRHTITLRNLLNMSSGLQWNENYSDQSSDVFQMVLSSDEAAYVIGKPLAHTPGSVWNYSTGDSEVLGYIAGQTAGVSGPTFDAYLHQVLLDPLGINPVQVGFDPAGNWDAGWFTNTTTRNFAKLGLLYLRNGTWEDQPFLSPGWVDFVRTPSPAYSGYGGQFWLNGDGSFRMVGLYGQTVVIVPALDLVVAVNNGGSAQPMVDLFRDAAPVRCGANARAVDDQVTAPPRGTVTIPVLANDRGGANGLAPGTLTIVTPPAHGTATVVGRRIRYTAGTGSPGSDALSYAVCSIDRRECPRATVHVTMG
jgi:CubicO group peptidase (beta-lactamase class C family)